MLSEQTNNMVARLKSELDVYDLSETFKKCYNEYSELYENLNDFYTSVEPLLWMRYAFDWGIKSKCTQNPVPISTWVIINSRWEEAVIQNKWYDSESLKVACNKLTQRDIIGRLNAASRGDQYYDLKALYDERHGLRPLVKSICDMGFGNFEDVVRIEKPAVKEATVEKTELPGLNIVGKYDAEADSNINPRSMLNPMRCRHNRLIKDARHRIAQLYERTGDGKSLHETTVRVNAYCDGFKQLATRFEAAKDPSKMLAIRSQADRMELDFAEFLASLEIEYTTPGNDDAEEAAFKKEAEDYCQYEDKVKQLQGMYNVKPAKKTKEEAKKPQPKTETPKAPDPNPQPKVEPKAESPKAPEPKLTAKPQNRKIEYIEVIWDFRDEGGNYALIRLPDSLAERLYRRGYKQVVHATNSAGTKTFLMFRKLGKFNVRTYETSNKEYRATISSVDINKFIFNRYNVEQGNTIYIEYSLKDMPDGIRMVLGERI